MRKRPSLRKGDKFRVDWDKLIADYRGDRSPIGKNMTAYQRSLKAKWGATVFTASKVYKGSGIPGYIVMYKIPDGHTAIGVEYVVKVKVKVKA